MKVELSVYRRILRSMSAVKKRFSWSNDALFCVLGISASQMEFTAAGYGTNTESILHHCFSRPSIVDNERDKYTERLRVAFSLLKCLEEIHTRNEFQRVAESRRTLMQNADVQPTTNELNKANIEKSLSEEEEQEEEEESSSLQMTNYEKEKREQELKTNNHLEKIECKINIVLEEKDTEKSEEVNQAQFSTENENEEEKQVENDNHNNENNNISINVDTTESPGTVVTNATLLLDYYNYQLVPLVMRVLLTPDEKIPSYAYMLPPEPFYAFEISQQRSYAHMIDVLYVLSQVASTSASSSLSSEGICTTHKLPYQPEHSTLKTSRCCEEDEEKQSIFSRQEEKERENDSCEYKETLSQATAASSEIFSTGEDGVQRNVERVTGIDSINENNNGSQEQLCSVQSRKQFVQPQWPKTMPELISAMKKIPCRTRAWTDYLEVEVFSHYLCSGVNPTVKHSATNDKTDGSTNHHGKENSTRPSVLDVHLTSGKANKLRNNDSNNDNNNNDKNNENKNNKDDFVASNGNNVTSDAKNNADAESNDEMRSYALNAAMNDNAHLFQITIMVRNTCTENESTTSVIHYQTLSHHFMLLNCHDHTLVETVGPGLCGNKVHLEPGNSHVFQTGVVVNGASGVFRGTLQVIKIREDGQMSTFDAIIAPTRLSVPEEMFESVRAATSKDKSLTEKSKKSIVTEKEENRTSVSKDAKSVTLVDCDEQETTSTSTSRIATEPSEGNRVETTSQDKTSTEVFTNKKCIDNTEFSNAIKNDVVMPSNACKEEAKENVPVIADGKENTLLRSLDKDSIVSNNTDDNSNSNFTETSEMSNILLTTVIEKSEMKQKGENTTNNEHKEEEEEKMSATKSKVTKDDITENIMPKEDE